MQPGELSLRWNYKSAQPNGGEQHTKGRKKMESIQNGELKQIYDFQIVPSLCKFVMFYSGVN